MISAESSRTARRAALILRIVALAGFALVAAFLLSLELVALVPALQELLLRLGDVDEHVSPLLRAGAPLLVLLAILTITGVIAALLWRMRLHSWRWIAAGCVAVAALLAYLAIDDPVILHPITVDNIGPAFPGAELSFEVLMRYGKQHSLGKSFDQVPYMLDARFKWDIRNPDRWREAITAKRVELEKNWTDLASQRAWWSELNAFERLGDLTPARLDAEIITFGVFRAVSQHAVAIASLQALDGRGDEAIDTILPVLQVGRKLQSSSRTLIRMMVGVVLERLALDAAGFVLDNTALSPSARARLAAALQGGDGEADARHLVATDYAMTLGSCRCLRVGDIFDSLGNKSPLRSPLNALSVFLYNPRATFNLYGDYIVEQQEFFAHRQIEQADIRGINFIKQDARPRFKNLFGAMFVAHNTPAYRKVYESYWKTYDARAALLDRLRKI